VASRWVLVWLSAAAFVRVFSTAVAMPFFHALKILARPAQVLLLEAFLNLVLSLLFVHRLGINGVALATFLPGCVSVLILPRILARSLGLKEGRTVVQAVVPALALALTVSAVHLALGGVPLPSYLSVAVRILLTLVPAALITVVTSSRVDRQNAQRTASRLVDVLKSRLAPRG
jgi:peptidoglycan biosynthesis protein MviN/MurJ (putative lipid II flippase)